MRRRKKVWYFWFCWIDFLPFFLEIVNHDVVNHSQHSDSHIKLTWQLRPKCSFKQNHFPEKKKHLILLKVVLLKCSTLNLVAVNLCHLNNPSYIITFFSPFYIVSYLNLRCLAEHRCEDRQYLKSLLLLTRHRNVGQRWGQVPQGLSFPVASWFEYRSASICI